MENLSNPLTGDGLFQKMGKGGDGVQSVAFFDPKKSKLVALIPPTGVPNTPISNFHVE